MKHLFSFINFYSIRYGVVLFMVVFEACGQRSTENNANNPITRNSIQAASLIDTSGDEIASRFLPPAGYKRSNNTNNSFAEYLSHLPLKPYGSTIKYYNGGEKYNHDVYAAVVDLAIGQRDLHQCADAVIRLRADYLWHNKQYDKIHFNFTNGFKADYTRWRKGGRIRVSGNHVKWAESHGPSESYEDFWKYLEIVFSYAGTASLEKELKLIPIENANIGDVLIQGGFPGHAVIIVDKAYSESENKSLFLLAQSYMPAQEIQILLNPRNSNDNPWYDLSGGQTIKTPEWTFTSEDLKRF